MKAKRRKSTAAFKAQLALSAIQERETLVKLSSLKIQMYLLLLEMLE